MRILRALIRKEFLQVARDPATVFVTLLLPLVLMFIFGYGVNLDVGRFRVGVVLEGDDPNGLSLLDAFGNSRYFAVVSGRDIRAFRDDLTAGRLKGLIVVPRDFGRLLASGHGPSIQIVTDGSDANTASFVRAYSQMAIMNWQANALQEKGRPSPPAIRVESRSWYNPELISRNFLMPGSMSMILTITGVILTALVIAREWERGTMESLMATTAGIYEIIMAKLLAYFVLAVVSMALCWGMAVFWYGVPFRGSLPALLALGSIFLWTALGQGLMISTLTKSQYLAAELALITAFLPSFLLSGVIFEISSMPLALRLITRLVPARYFVSSLQTIFLAGDVWPLFARSMAAMAAIGSVYFLITARRTVKKVA
ncbi:MAG: ABC transporter permease [Deltaproteobacteria bacterium]|jgi:ABC-2 type transport system permease protein|nr:ABC transporter permease [Deltaproteobacteria bacterium]